MKKYKNAAIALTLSVFNCQNEILPKQNGYLSLNYPESKYQKEEIPVPFTFELNKNSNINNGQLTTITVKIKLYKPTAAALII